MLGVALEFKNLPDTTTPINATNLNNMQSSLYELIMNAALDAAHPVGSYIETSDTSYDPNESLVGTWVLENDGTVLVSKSSTTGSKFNENIGTVVGEEKHALTIAEMPRHNHQFSYKWKIATVGNADWAAQNTDASGLLDNVIGFTGNNEAHNNVQPSKIVNRWHRTA